MISSASPKWDAGSSLQRCIFLGCWVPVDCPLLHGTAVFFQLLKDDRGHGWTEPQSPGWYLRLSPDETVALWTSNPADEAASCLSVGTGASCGSAWLRLPDTPSPSGGWRLKGGVAALTSGPHWVVASRASGLQRLSVWAAASWVRAFLQPHGLNSGLCSRLRRTAGLVVSIIWALEVFRMFSSSFRLVLELSDGVGGLDWGGLGLNKAWSKWIG